MYMCNVQVSGTSHEDGSDPFLKTVLRPLVFSFAATSVVLRTKKNDTTRIYSVRAQRRQLQLYYSFSL